MTDISSYLVYVFLLLIVVFVLWTKKKRSIEGVSFLFRRMNFLAFQDYFVVLVISCLVGFRFEVGVDWSSYKSYFDSVATSNVAFREQTMELGFFLLNRFSHYLGGDHRLMFFFSAALSWVFILKSFPAKLIPLTIFFIFCDEYFFWSMNGVRQFIAISVFAFSLQFIIRRNFVRYVCFIFIASMFHVSVLIFIPLYYLPFHKVYNQKVWIALFFLSFVFSQSAAVIGFFEQSFLMLSSSLSFLVRYNKYFDSQFFEVRENLGTGAGYLFRQLISFFILIMSKPLIKRYPEAKVYFLLFLVGVILSNLFFMVQIINRFTDYLLIFRSYLLALSVFYLFNIRKKYNYIGYGLVVIYFIFYLFTINNSSNECCPYNVMF